MQAFHGVPSRQYSALTDTTFGQDPFASYTSGYRGAAMSTGDFTMHSSLQDTANYPEAPRRGRGGPGGDAAHTTNPFGSPVRDSMLNPSSDEEGASSLVPGTPGVSDMDTVHALGAFAPDRVAPSTHGAISSTGSLSNSGAMHALDGDDSRASPPEIERASSTEAPVDTADVDADVDPPQSRSKPAPLSLGHELQRRKCSSETQPGSSPDTPAFGQLKTLSGAFADAAGIPRRDPGGASRGLSAAGSAQFARRGSCSSQGISGATGKLLGKTVEECRDCVRDILGAAAEQSKVPAVRSALLLRFAACSGRVDGLRASEGMHVSRGTLCIGIPGARSFPSFTLKYFSSFLLVTLKKKRSARVPPDQRFLTPCALDYVVLCAWFLLCCVYQACKASVLVVLVVGVW